jgi:hypothetical protein
MLMRVAHPPQTVWLEEAYYARDQRDGASNANNGDAGNTDIRIDAYGAEQPGPPARCAE